MNKSDEKRYHVYDKNGDYVGEMTAAEAQIYSDLSINPEEDALKLIEIPSNAY